MRPPLRRFANAYVVTAAACALFGGLVFTLARHAPSERDLPVILTSPQILVEARYLLPDERAEFARHAVCRCGLWLGAEQIPPLLKRALIAQEDTRFYIHRGIDWIGIGRALLSDLSGGAIQGGSTLTQQLVKNLITGNARAGFSGVTRKVREAVIARRVERALTKEQILTAYLNQMDFGSTDGTAAIGIVQAAFKYFGKPVKDLNLYEAAMLVGTLRGTTVFNPSINPDAAGRQAKAVLQKMFNQNLIGENDLFRALRQEVQRGPRPPVAISTGYYIAWSRAEFAGIARSHPARGQVRYVVGLNTWHQVQGDAAIKTAIAGNAGRHVGQGALVSLESDGRVSALVGGADFAASQFDRATQAMRQPGSAFKLIVYAAAMEMGLNPGSVRQDAPISAGDWRPDNADHKFFGPITLKQAFALSRNTVAARVGLEVGVDSIMKQAHELGIRSPLGPDLSLALGTSEVTLLELTSAYVPFMNEGRTIQPYAARIALDSSGEVIYLRDPTPEVPVVSARTVHDMRDMLRAVVTEGTGRSAQLRDLWSAGKTGTSQGNRDAWFIGFTDRVTTGIWFGNDDNSQMTDVSGATMPAEAWRRFNEAIIAPPAAGPLGAPGPLVSEKVERPRADRRPPERRLQMAMQGSRLHRGRHGAGRDRADPAPRGKAGAVNTL